MSSDFYHSFENRYRGRRDEIKRRLMVYADLLDAVDAAFPSGSREVLDLGCGRGEWLEILAEYGFSAVGVDRDSAMLAECRKRGIQAYDADVLEYLNGLPDSSISLITGFHIVEHLPFATLQQLVQQSLRVLMPGGVLIMETPNPENLTVGTSSFYLDPTHQKPIPAPLLRFLPEYYGFKRVAIRGLQESIALKEQVHPGLMDVFQGASPDYAVIAQKDSPAEVLNVFAPAFDTEYGVTLAELAAKHDDWVTRTESVAEAALRKAGTADHHAGQALEKAGDADRHAGQALEKAGDADHHAGQAFEKADIAGHQAAMALRTLDEESHRLGLALQKIDTLEHQVKEITGIAAEARDCAFQAQHNAALMHEQLQNVYASNSWRITAPIRQISGKWSWFKRGVVAWLSFAPGSRPQRLTRQFLLHTKLYIGRRPWLKHKTEMILSRFPGVRQRLKRLETSHDYTDTADIHAWRITQDVDLPPHARSIYSALEREIKRRSEKGDS